MELGQEREKMRNISTNRYLVMTMLCVSIKIEKNARDVSILGLTKNV